MKHFFSVALVPVLAAASFAQDNPFQADAYLIYEDGRTQDVWITAATDAMIRYRETPVSMDFKDLKIAEVQSIYLFEPEEFTAAMDLFESRKYEEARQRFAGIKKRHAPVSKLRGNFSTLSAFYEMECMRKLRDLEALSAALRDFIKDPLVREDHRSQVDLYVFWDAVRTESWDRIDALAKGRADERLPQEHRAQVAWCHGMALEKLGRPLEALRAFNIAMTADAGGADTEARDAALGVMRIHLADPEVQSAMKLWGTPDENSNSAGHFRLLEAAAVARMFETSLGGGTPLPAEFKALLKFAPAPAEA